MTLPTPCPICGTHFNVTGIATIGDTTCPSCGSWLGIVGSENSIRYVSANRRLSAAVFRIKECVAKIEAGLLTPLEAAMQIEDLVDTSLSEDLYFRVTQCREWGPAECHILLRELDLQHA